METTRTSKTQYYSMNSINDDLYKQKIIHLYRFIYRFNELMGGYALIFFIDIDSNFHYVI